MPNFGTYDGKDISVVIDGTYITGLGEDGVTGEKDEDFFETSYGAQGDCVKSVVNNNAGTITLTLQKTSPQYGYVLGLAKRKTTFPIWVTNSSTGERFGGSMASLRNYPSTENGTEHSDAEFDFAVFDYENTM